MKKQISGWGKNTFVKTNIFFPKNLSELKKNIKNNCIARGLGRSYGDSSINSVKTIITTNLKKIINFDKKKFPLLKMNMIVIKISKRYFRPNEVDNLIGNANKAKKILKWKPKTNIHYLIKEMMDSDLEYIRKSTLR